MFGTVEDVILNRVRVRWADGVVTEHYKSELEPVQAPSIQK